MCQILRAGGKGDVHLPVLREGRRLETHEVMGNFAGSEDLQGLRWVS